MSRVSSSGSHENSPGTKPEGVGIVDVEAVDLMNVIVSVAFMNEVVLKLAVLYTVVVEFCVMILVDGRNVDVTLLIKMTVVGTNFVNLSELVVTTFDVVVRTSVSSMWVT